MVSFLLKTCLYFDQNQFLSGRLAPGSYAQICLHRGGEGLERLRGDRTYVDLYVTVLPPRTQAVVISIDRSFTASVSVTDRGDINLLGLVKFQLTESLQESCSEDIGTFRRHGVKARKRMLWLVFYWERRDTVAGEFTEKDIYLGDQRARIVWKVPVGNVNSRTGPTYIKKRCVNWFMENSM